MENIQNQNYSIQESSRMDICKRCGRKLKNPESIEIGFGAICFKKFMAESLLKPLFEVKQREVNETEKNQIEVRE